MKSTKVSVVEIICYSLFGLVALWGLVYLCFGFACSFISVYSPVYGCDGYLRSASKGLGFLEQGILIFVLGVAALVTTLLITSKKSDKEFEKSQRRAARLSQRNQVIDAEIKEVKADK